MKIKIFIVTTLLLLLSACASPFTQYYQDSTAGVGVKGNPILMPFVGDPIVRKGDNPKEDLIKMVEDGYVKIGLSSFNAGNVNEDGALNQARAVNAAIVLIYSKYTNTVTGAMPLVTPNTTVSNTYVNGSSYGRPFNANAQTTTYGTQTTYIPYSVNRSDYLAVFYAKAKPPALGISTVEIPSDMRRSVGTNKGVLIFAVVKQSPAFYADVFRGDIIEKINGVDIYSPQQFVEQAKKNSGTKTEFLLIRDGKLISKKIDLH